MFESTKENKFNTTGITARNGNGTFFEPFIQRARASSATRLTINQPNDSYEQEAEAISGKIMRMADNSIGQRTFFKPAITSIQRKCAACEEEDRRMQRKETDGTETTTGDQLESYVGGLHMGGQKLPGAVRNFFEPRFGHDFGNIKVHTDAAAVASAQSVKALAYTSGNDIVFNETQYDPATDKGKRLLAHELTHTIQQEGATTGGSLQRQQPSAAVAPPACQTPETPMVQSVNSEMFQINDEKKPCYACPNSNPDACPKLAQKVLPPIATGPVQFSWQVRFLTLYTDKETGKRGPGKYAYVVQRMESVFNFTAAPAQPYRYDALYWEAFALDSGGNTEIDYWQFEIPDNTAGTWEKKATLYVTDQLPPDMARGNVLDAGNAFSTTTEPKRLSTVRGTRRITGRFDFTGANKLHTFQ